MNRHRLGFIAGLLLLAGCSNNDFTDDGNIIPDGQKKTISSITAVMDEADTRAQLVEGHKVAWDQGDYMMVYSDLDEWDGRQYDLVSGAGTSTGSLRAMKCLVQYSMLLLVAIPSGMTGRNKRFLSIGYKK